MPLRYSRGESSFGNSVTNSNRAAAKDSALERLFASGFRKLGAASDREKLLLTVALGIALVYAAAFAFMRVHDIWIVDSRGHPLFGDFVVYWTAGHEALSGHAAAIYDLRLHHAAEVGVVGHGFSEGLEWFYPPLFLFVAVPLALLPYAPAFLVFVTSTLVLHAATTAAIAKQRIAFILALLPPWVPVGVLIGQNGFLTAGLFGFVLLALERRPVVSGLLLGLLSYKPQFGLLIPLALAAGGYWRAFVWAALAALATNGLACAIFGTDTLWAFFHALFAGAQGHLVNGVGGWGRFQSPYGFLRASGCPDSVAGAGQVIATLSMAAIVVLSWRAKIPYALKAAILAAVTPLATPYVLFYDLPVLTVAAAFLHRYRAFDRTELVMLASGLAVSCTFFLLPVPGGMFAVLAVVAVALRRLYFCMPART